MDVRRENGCTSRKWMYVEKMDVRRENGCTSRKWMYVEKMDVRLRTKGDVYAKTRNNFHSYHGLPPTG